MKIVLLVEEHLNPIPAKIKKLQDWGEVTIRTDTADHVTGMHVMLEGEREDFEQWLAPFDGFWLGVGHPQMQQFEARHVKL